MEALSDLWSYLSTAESWWGQRGILQRTEEHIRLSVTATAIAALISIPPAIYLAHIRKGGFLAVSVVNIGRAVPTFAIIALVFPLSLRWGFGLGFWPTAVALVCLAIPPMFTNAYTGVREVEADTVEAARGMGMTGGQVLRRVELPNAMPLVLTGVRVSAVQVVATATLGALVGFGGLGAFIIEGFAQFDDGKLLTGALLVAVLSLLTDAAFGLVERLATPWRRASGRDVLVRDAMIHDELVELDGAHGPDVPTDLADPQRAP